MTFHEKHYWQVLPFVLLTKLSVDPNKKTSAFIIPRYINVCMLAVVDHVNWASQKLNNRSYK